MYLAVDDLEAELTMHIGELISLEISHREPKDTDAFGLWVRVIQSPALHVRKNDTH